MTNGEKFKNTVDRARQFKLFCKSQQHGCNKCELTTCAGDGCRYAWLDLEYKEELKTCPFCGGEAVFDEEILFLVPSYRVKCSACEMGTDFYSFKQPAIDAWNRRVK